MQFSQPSPLLSISRVLFSSNYFTVVKSFATLKKEELHQPPGTSTGVIRLGHPHQTSPPLYAGGITIISCALRQWRVAIIIRDIIELLIDGGLGGFSLTALRIRRTDGVGINRHPPILSQTPNKLNNTQSSSTHHHRRHAHGDEPGVSSARDRTTHIQYMTFDVTSAH